MRHAPPPLRSRWDGSRLLFEIEMAGARVPCAISRGALHELAQHRHLGALDPLRCFLALRPEIEALAATKLTSRPEGVYGTVSLWADDIDDPPARPAAARVLSPTGYA